MQATASAFVVGEVRIQEGRLNRAQHHEYRVRKISLSKFVPRLQCSP